MIVKIQTRNRVWRARLGRFLCYVNRFAGGVKFDDAVTLRVFDPVSEHSRSVGPTGGTHKQLGQAMAVKDVVPEGQSYAVAVDKLFSNYECLCYAGWCCLYFVVKSQAPILAAAE